MTYGELKKKADKLGIEDDSTIGVAITDKRGNTMYSYDNTSVSRTINIMLVNVDIDFNLD